jgi:hypothetical protein
LPLNSVCIADLEVHRTQLINHLWSGTIAGIDEALQLILILDYIVDWARDIYRPNILRQLRMLTSSNHNETMTLPADPDVFSLNGDEQPWMRGLATDLEDMVGAAVPEQPPEESVGDEIPNVLDKFATSTGLVKDARQIQSQLRGLLITPDNLGTILSSFENPNAATRFVRSILSLFSRRCIALESEDVLDAIEEEWTGNTRIRPTRTGPGSRPKIYIQIRVSFYINTVWEQVREYTYLAATEDARDILMQRADFRGAVRRTRFSPPEYKKEGLISAINRVRQLSVRGSLIACLRRRTFKIDLGKIPTLSGSQETGEDRPVFKQDKAKNSPGVLMQGIVHAIYEKHRIGNREPSEPFLRASTRIDSKDRPLWKDWEDGDTLPRVGEDSSYAKIVVYSDIPDAKYLPKGSGKRYCIYILDGRVEEVDKASICSALKWTWHEGVYSTVRKAKVPRDSRNWQDNRFAHFFSFRAPYPWCLKIEEKRLRYDLMAWICATGGKEHLRKILLTLIKANAEPGTRVISLGRLRLQDYLMTWIKVDGEPGGSRVPVVGGESVRFPKTWYISKAAVSALGSRGSAANKVYTYLLPHPIYEKKKTGLRRGPVG